MTLIEVMVVVLIMALAATGLSFGFGGLTRSRLRSACTRLVAAARFAYNRSIIHGKTHRIVFDLPGNGFSLQEAHGHVTLARAEDERKRAVEEEDKDAARVGVDPWAAAQARLQEVYKPTLGASPFGPLTNQRGESLKRYSEVKLAKGVLFSRLQIGHEKHPLEEGKGSVHFFAHGFAEHAIIQLRDASETVYSVEIHPLTGRGRVYTEAYEPEHLLDDGETSEVEDR